MPKKTVLAIDLGAESGRVSAVSFDGKRLQIEALHRFSNTAVTVRGTLYWNFINLWKELQDGLAKGRTHNPSSLGVDTWAVDFGLLDHEGKLIGNPVHYRDTRTDGMMEKVFAKVGKSAVFEHTGIQFMPINTLYQMMSMVESRSAQLKIAETFLTVPDLLNYWLTGTKVCEFTNATTTQLYNPRKKSWATDLMNSLGIPTKIFPDIVPPGTRLGTYDGIPVIAPACHDTGSAVAALPAKTPHVAYISSGTWSLVGLEVREPVINSEGLKANVTNEGGVEGTFRLLKNVMGMWIVQQCRAAWQKSGESFSYDRLTKLASDAPPFRSFVPPNDPMFLPPGNHPQLIRDFCCRTGQPVPDTYGAVVRCVLESLALKYRDVLETLISLSGQPVEALHVVGGGSRNDLLCQMTANATALPVIAGPVEAATIGNALVQLMALGEIANLQEARQLVTTVGELKQYEPQNKDMWNDAFRRFKQVTASS